MGIYLTQVTPTYSMARKPPVPSRPERAQGLLNLSGQRSRPIESRDSCPDPAEGSGHQFCGSPSHRKFVTRPDPW